MEAFEEERVQQPEAESVFPTAVSEEELGEARRKQLLGSSQTFVAAAEKSRRRPERQASLLLRDKAAEHHMKGKEAMEKRQYERAVICFSKAIHLQPQQPQLYANRGDAYLQLCDFQSAADSYKHACLLEPGPYSHHLAFIYYLQGRCLFDRGLFLEARESFDKAAQVKPGCKSYQVKSLACLSAAGCQSDCLKLVNDWIVSEGPTSDLYILRARLQKQLNQMSKCYRDVKSALALNPSCPQAVSLLLQLQKSSDRARQGAVDRAVSGQLPEALRLIHVSLENIPEDPRLYLFRGTLYRRLKDFTAAIEDLVQAVELSDDDEVRGLMKAGGVKEDCSSVGKDARFQLVLAYNDFAVRCFCRGLYDEAILLLNKAIEEEKNQAGLYLNRGDCFFQQRQWCYALADYQQAEEIAGPDEPAVRVRLAVLHNALGSFCFQDGRFEDAAFRFSLALCYNPTVSQYYESRAKAYRKILKLDHARKDLICTMILDPANTELPPMLMSLFPGCRASDVLSSPTGQAVRVQLLDAIRAYRPSSDQRLRNRTLSRDDTAQQADEGKEPRLRVDQRHLHATTVETEQQVVADTETVLS